MSDDRAGSVIPPVERNGDRWNLGPDTGRTAKRMFTRVGRVTRVLLAGECASADAVRPTGYAAGMTSARSAASFRTPRHPVSYRASAMAWLLEDFTHPERVDLPTGHHLRPMRETDAD